ncbi:pentaheme c-type cytochrome TorC [Rhodobacteraceae bacterium RKSG542]|nr:pentaheme c-type cytochrome TorC [Pseudovibrio flavus]
MKNLALSFWRVMSKPATKISLGVLAFGGFLTGIVFWGGFNTAMEMTNTEQFCIGCHEMRDNVYVELQDTIHYTNRTGVRATCPDCHVPHNWSHKVARKMQASKEVFGWVFGTINTKEKFEAKRLELAQHEWARFAANNSLECRSCHNYDSMDWEKMSPAAKFYMQPASERNVGCIECHKGIAHHLPINDSGVNPILAKVEQGATSQTLEEGKQYFVVKPIAIYEDEDLTKQAGTLSYAAPVKVIEKKDDKVKLQLKGWRKDKGFGRVYHSDFGKNIRVAVMEKDPAQNPDLISVGLSQNDPATGLDWSEVTVEFWAKEGAFIPDVATLWNAAGEIYSSNCSTCHAQPDPAHFDANSWPAQFNGMVGFTSMDPSTQALVLTYLQLHSSDYAEGTH